MVSQPPQGLSRRALVSALAATAVLGASGCEIRLGAKPVPVVPTLDPAESARDALARQAIVISTTASAAARTGSEPVHQLAGQIKNWAASQEQTLGGVWQPWPTATALPSFFPTAAPVVTAAADAGIEDLVSCLSAGVDLARSSCEQADAPEAARSYASLAVSWTLWLQRLSPDSLEERGRDLAKLTAPLPKELLLAYDSTRFTLQTVAARSVDADRERASADAQAADAVVRASIALGGDDPREPTYTPPQVAADGLQEKAWAREAEMGLMLAEITAVSSFEGAARTQAIDGAVDAALRARRWGAAPSEDPWPGLAA
ncbi:DUF4439 domain-containing protein [Actinomyces trachealis]|uniref:DUF4439 domain-containing protein n=1 Tax=Actinomyces trachealis TaxID=2763540 RepID=UPI00189290EE|nr:DUF4439 domain-containing protein [Actinomyces trachealis]